MEGLIFFIFFCCSYLWGIFYGLCKWIILYIYEFYLLGVNEVKFIYFFLVEQWSIMGIEKSVYYFLYINIFGVVMFIVKYFIRNVIYI